MEKRETRGQDKAESRRTRAPLNSREPLHVNPSYITPGYHGFWAIDREGELQKYLDAGYRFVERKTTIGQGSVNDSAGVEGRVTRTAGGGYTHYLMEIPEEWYLEDQAMLEDRIVEMEDQILGVNQLEGEYGTGATQERAVGKRTKKG
jgi:hypothetical protein